mgnify:CR=1 FL=1
MFFTKEDFQRIENYLKNKSIRDTEFPTTYHVNDIDTIVITQDNYNKKLSIGNFVNSLGLFDKYNYFINVTEKYNAESITLNEAISLIPSKDRRKGAVITFLNTKDTWETYQFIGSLVQWNMPEMWLLLTTDINNLINKLNNLSDSINNCAKLKGDYNLFYNSNTFINSTSFNEIRAKTITPNGSLILKGVNQIIAGAPYNEKPNQVFATDGSIYDMNIISTTRINNNSGDNIQINKPFVFTTDDGYFSTTINTNGSIYIYNKNNKKNVVSLNTSYGVSLYLSSCSLSGINYLTNAERKEIYNGGNYDIFTASHFKLRDGTESQLLAGNGSTYDANKIVTIDDSQTINGNKTFNGSIIVKDDTLHITYKNNSYTFNMDKAIELGILQQEFD